MSSFLELLRNRAEARMHVRVWLGRTATLRRSPCWCPFGLVSAVIMMACCPGVRPFCLPLQVHVSRFLGLRGHAAQGMERHAMVRARLGCLGAAHQNQRALGVYTAPSMALGPQPWMAKFEEENFEEELLLGLNPAQKTAVKAPPGPMIVLAGPGMCRYELCRFVRRSDARLVGV